jgi:hypothetical protein
MIFPVDSLISRENLARDLFAQDCPHHQSFDLADKVGKRTRPIPGKRRSSAPFLTSTASFSMPQRRFWRLNRRHTAQFYLKAPGQ